MDTSKAQRVGHAEWMDLKAIQAYACVSERTLREWIRRPYNPLPASQVDKKILIRRSTFDRWLESHAVQLLGKINVDGIVNEVLHDLKGTIN